jgi:hypothetical protein
MDPVADILEKIRYAQVNLDINIEAVKAWMSIQHSHNELFTYRISQLEEKMEKLEEK